MLLTTQGGVVRSASIGLSARSSSSHSSDYSIAAVSSSHSEEVIFMMMICHESSAAAAAAGSSLSLIPCIHKDDCFGTRQQEEMYIQHKYRWPFGFFFFFFFFDRQKCRWNAKVCARSCSDYRSTVVCAFSSSSSSSSLMGLVRTLQSTGWLAGGGGKCVCDLSRFEWGDRKSH